MRNSARAVQSLALALAIAHSGSAALGPSYGGTLDLGLDALPTTLDPAPARGAGARALSALVHETLVTLTADGEAMPSLAASWSAAGREWTLRLRPGALFHDGTPITSADVVRSLQRFLRSTSPAGGWLARHVTGLAAADPRRVVITVDEDVHGVLEALAAPAAAITSARGAGAGPFVPTTNTPVQGRLALVQFAHHLRGRPFLDAIAVRIGNGDIAPSSEGPLAATLLLVAEPRGALSSDDARRAVAASVDGADLARHFFPGAVATQSLVPPTLLLAPPAGPRRSRREGNGALTLRVSSDVPMAVSQRVAAQLGGAGFQVAATSATPDEVWTVAANVRLISWTPEVAEPLLALEELAALAPGAATDAVRDLLRAAAREADRDRRHVLLLRADAALRASAVLVPIASVPVGFRARPGVAGVVVDAAGRIRLEDAWIAP